MAALKGSAGGFALALIITLSANWWAGWMLAGREQASEVAVPAAPLSAPLPPPARLAAELPAAAAVAPVPEQEEQMAAPPPPPKAPGSPPTRPAALVVGSVQHQLINADRAAAGLPPLGWSPCLAGIAAQQARAMAAAHQIFHGSGTTQDFGCGLGSLQTGENVGYWSAGIDDAAINRLFMASAPHRVNIDGPYHYVGTAWAVGSDSRGYIAVEFA